MASNGRPAPSRNTQGAKPVQSKKQNSPSLAALSACDLFSGQEVLVFGKHCTMLNSLTKHADKLKESNHNKQFKALKALHGVLSKQHAELSAAMHTLCDTMDTAHEDTRTYVLKLLNLRDWHDFVDLTNLTMPYLGPAVMKITGALLDKSVEQQRYAHYFQETVGTAVDRHVTDGCCGHLHDDLYDKVMYMCMPIWLSPRSLHIMLFIATRVLYNKNVFNGNPNNEHVNALGEYWAQRRADAVLRELIRDRLDHATSFDFAEFFCEDWIDVAAEFRYFAEAWKAKKCTKTTAAAPASIWKPCFHMVHAETLRMLQIAARSDIESKVKIVVSKQKLPAELVDMIHKAALKVEEIPEHDVAVKLKSLKKAESPAHLPLCQGELPLKHLHNTMHQDWQCARLTGGLAKIALPIAREPEWTAELEYILAGEM